MVKNKTYLLDTQILIWWLTNDKRLTDKIKEVIQNSDNLILYSTVNLWEISIKRAIGKLTLTISLNKLVKSIPFQALSIKNEHILKLDKLPLTHKDPFDRVLVAQAISEKSILITADKKILKYNVQTLTP